MLSIHGKVGIARKFEHLVYFDDMKKIEPHDTLNQFDPELQNGRLGQLKKQQWHQL